MSASKRLFRANASSTPGWHDVNWYVVYRHVRQLQVRIVKATKEGEWRKVERLQHLLTHALAAKLLAVRCVTDAGERTTLSYQGLSGVCRKMLAPFLGGGSLVTGSCYPVKAVKPYLSLLM